MIRLKFNSTENRDAFASRFNLTNKVDELQLDVEWNFLHFAKLDDNCVDYDELLVLQSSPNANQEMEFVVKGDPAVFGPYGTVLNDLGGGFYHVKSNDGTVLGDYVESIEYTSGSIKYLGDIQNFDNTSENIDPASPEAQWARLRVVSRYRPLATTFSTHEVVYKSKPELIVMDSGIKLDHPEFDYETLDKENYYALPKFNGDFTDTTGHGTAVSSCAVGKNLGVSFNARLVSVKINSYGVDPTLIELGMAMDAVMARVSSNPTITRIVNMSWTITRSPWLDSKIKALLDAGVTVVCAAGNNGVDVEDVTPAGIPEVITVGSIDKYDIPSGFNNISPSDAGITTGSGLSLDIFAPGENVYVAKSGGAFGYGYESGTSFASPYVAGTALGIASLFPTLVPYAELKQLVLSQATKDALLFEDERFSDNQNNLVYLPYADSTINQKANELLSYVGFLSDDNLKLEFNIRSLVNTEILNQPPESYSIKFLDSDQEAIYKPYFETQPDGKVTITYPRFEMPEDIKLVLVQFVVVANHASAKIESPIIFFYDTNYNYKTTLESDLTLALTNVNSISFFAANTPIK